MRVLAVDSCVASPRAVATKADAEAVVDGVTDLAAPHALFGMASAFFGNSVANRGADLLDPHGREREGDLNGRVDVTLEASKGVGLGKAGQTSVEGLPFYFQRLTKLAHPVSKTIAGLLVRAKVLDLASQCGVVLMKDGPVDASRQFEVRVIEEFVAW